jgi:uracil-DNA glycosylase
MRNPPLRLDFVRTLAEAASDAATCTRCGLADTRTQVVYGVGDPDADLLLIGEGPGADEDRIGEPFVGRAGQLLTKTLADVGIPRETIYITNTVKCRPPGNRDPQPAEIEACNAWLTEQFEILDPLLIVTVGNPATKLMLQTKVGITKLRGQTYRVGERWLLPTLHPSYVLRNGPGSSAEQTFREDLAKAADVVGRLRAAKQRGDL